MFESPRGHHSFKDLRAGSSSVVLTGSYRRVPDHSRGRFGGPISCAVATFSFIVGLCIVLVKVARVPEYWMPLMVGIGLLLFGLVRRLTRKGT